MRDIPQKDSKTSKTCFWEAIADSLFTLGRSGTDDRAIARSILPGLQANFAKPFGEFKGKAPVEAWDEATKTWLPWGGDDMLLRDVEAALNQTFPQFTLGPVGRGEEDGVVPQPARHDERFGNSTMLVRVNNSVHLLLKPQRPLDDEVATRHLLHFKCGMTLDLGPAHQQGLRGLERPR